MQKAAAGGVIPTYSVTDSQSLLLCCFQLSYLIFCFVFFFYLGLCRADRSTTHLSINRVVACVTKKKPQKALKKAISVMQSPGSKVKTGFVRVVLCRPEGPEAGTVNTGGAILLWYGRLAASA